MTKIELLSKGLWDIHDICEYLDVKKSKGYELMKLAKEKYNGAVKFNSSVVKRDSVLALMGLSVEREVYVNTLIGEVNEKRI